MEQTELTNTFKQMGEVMAKVAATFMDAFDKLIPVLRECVNEWAWLTGSSSAHRYALAGYPYGKNSRAKKRWVLEMKRRHR